MGYTDLLKLSRKTDQPSPVPEKQEEKAEMNGGVIPSHHDTVVANNHDTDPRSMDPIARVRKAVKEFGKEAATHRFTLEEKSQLEELEYEYKKRYRIRTTENEITRIAVNYLLHDHRQMGEASILHQVLKSLNS